MPVWAARPFLLRERCVERSRVLGIHRIGSGRAEYYLSDLARELPVGSAEVPGLWAGEAAAAMGLEGPVGPEAFEAVLGGRHPQSGHRLASRRAVVAGLDFTFSAPKSVSVLFALAGADTARRIVAAHSEAVSGALAYLEHHAIGVRRRAGAERSVLPACGVVAGRFTHAVNRNHDPHLHTHVVVANLVRGSDGRWGACDGRGVAAHRAAGSAVYDAHLRHELTRTLGVRWSRAATTSKEIEGVPATLIGEFSSRGADIRRRRHETGARSARGDRVAWAVTRTAKEAAPAYAVLVDEWRRRADHVERPERLSAALPTRPQPGRGTVDEHAFAAVLAPMPHGGAHRRDVVQAFAGAAPDGVPAHWVDRVANSWVTDPVTAVGVAEPLHRRTEVIPGGHLVEVLGARPLEPGAHDVWRNAAHAIDEYRRRWGLTRATDAFGLNDVPLSRTALGARRLADHVRTMDVVETARARLGRRQVPAVELFLGR